MLGHCLRRWLNIVPTLGQNIVFAKFSIFYGRYTYLINEIIQFEKRIFFTTKNICRPLKLEIGFN